MFSCAIYTGMRTYDAGSLPPIAQEDLGRKAISAILDGKRQVIVREPAKMTGNGSCLDAKEWIRNRDRDGDFLCGGKVRGIDRGPRYVFDSLCHTSPQGGLG